jgi:hypothetical protein
MKAQKLDSEADSKKVVTGEGHELVLASGCCTQPNLISTANGASRKSGG